MTASVMTGMWDRVDAVLISYMYVILLEASLGLQGQHPTLNVLNFVIY